MGVGTKENNAQEKNITCPVLLYIHKICLVEFTVDGVEILFEVHRKNTG